MASKFYTAFTRPPVEISTRSLNLDAGRMDAPMPVKRPATDLPSKLSAYFGQAADQVVETIKAIPQIPSTIAQSMAAATYDLLPLHMRILGEPQVAEVLSQKTNGASRVATDRVAQLKQTNQIVTQANLENQRALVSDLLFNPLETADDAGRAGRALVRTAALLITRAPASTTTASVVKPPVVHRSTQPKQVSHGTTVDLTRGPGNVYQAGGNQLWPALSTRNRSGSAASGVESLKATHKPVIAYAATTQLGIEQEALADNTVKFSSGRRTQSDHPPTQEIDSTRLVPYRVDWPRGEVFEFHGALRDNQLVSVPSDSGNHHYILNARNGMLQTAHGSFTVLATRSADKSWAQAVLPENQSIPKLITMLEQIRVENRDHITSVEWFSFENGAVARNSKVFEYEQTVIIPPGEGPSGLPHHDHGGVFSLARGFFPNRDLQLPTHTTVEMLLQYDPPRVPGHQGVTIDREPTESEYHQLAKKFGGQWGEVEVGVLEVDGELHLFSGNSDQLYASSIGKNAQWIEPRGHNHPSPGGPASLEDVTTALSHFQQTLKSYPNKRFGLRTKVVPNNGDGRVYSLHYGPKHAFKKEERVIDVDALGLDLDQVSVDVRLRERASNNGSVIRISVAPKNHQTSVAQAPDAFIADGAKIRAALLDLAKTQDLKLVTFEVDLQDPIPEIHEVITGLQQSHRHVVHSMVEPKYDFSHGVYLTNDTIYVWHMDPKNPQRHVTNAEVWLDQ